MTFPRLARYALLAPLAASLLLVACGGGDDDDSAQNLSPDQEFVKSLCSATATFQTGLTEAQKHTAGSGQPDQVFNEIIKPWEQYADDFSDADPPDDLKSWHKQAADDFKHAVSTAKKDHSLQALDAPNGDPLGTLPDAAETRLRQVRNSVSECATVPTLS